MRKLLLILLLSFSAMLAQAQDVAGDNLRIYKNASFGEDGLVYPIDVHGNRIINGGDPIGLQDYVTLNYFNNNTMVGDRPYVDFEVNELDPAYKQARLWYDSLRAEMVFYGRVVDLKFGTVSELSIRVLNNSGETITAGDAVYPTGAIGGFTTIDLAQANSYATSRPVGFAKNTMINGEDGWVMLKGVLENVNTSTATGGVAYLSPTNEGEIIGTIPTGGDFVIRMGAVAVVDAINGVINVDPFTNEYTAEVISPRGWSSDVIASAILAPNSGTRTFSIIGTGYTYEGGIKYPFDNPSVIWDDIEGTVDIYFDKGVLTSVNNLTESQVRSTYSSKSGGSRMYWDALNDTLIFANDMRHTFDMNGNTWSTFWDYHKCVVLEGLGIVDIQTGGTGNDAADAQFGHGSGVIRNQDIITSIPAVLSTTGYTVFYREGTTEWRSQDSPSFPILTTGTGRAAWNEDIAGTWQQTEVANGDFVLYHLFVSNTLGDKTGTLMGQADYATITGARDGALTEIQDLLFSQFPISELAPVATVIFETRTNYGNAVQSRTRQSTDPATGTLVDYIDWTKTDIAGGGTGGTGASSFDDLPDTPSVKTGSANKAVTVNGAEDALIYSDVVLTINGETPQAAGNYNITSTANKIGEDVTIGTSGTGIDAVFSIADGDNTIGGLEFQTLTNSKLNNSVDVTISNGNTTTITNLARIDFANDYTLEQSVSGNVIFNAGNSNNTGTNWTANNIVADGTILANDYITTSLGGGLSLSGENSPTSATIGHNYIDIDGVDVAPNPSSSSWKQTFTNSGTEKWSLAYRAASAGAGVFSDYVDVDDSGVLNSLSGYQVDDVTVIDDLRNILNITTASVTPIANNTGITINGATGINRSLSWGEGTGRRWQMYSNQALESGSNVGSNFEISSYSDTGVLIDQILFIDRFSSKFSLPSGGGFDVNGDINSSTYSTNGTDITVGGTLNNFAYLDQTNIFSDRLTCTDTYVIGGSSGGFIAGLSGGQLYNHSSFGVTLMAYAGSVSDFTILPPESTSPIMTVPTGTSNSIFGGSVTAPNFISNIAIGTQPYATTSTTLNTNLNADLLDGQEGSNYARTDIDETFSDNVDAASYSISGVDIDTEGALINYFYNGRQDPYSGDMNSTLIRGFSNGYGATATNKPSSTDGYVVDLPYDERNFRMQLVVDSDERYFHRINLSATVEDWTSYLEHYTSGNSNGSTFDWACNDLNYSGSLNDVSDERVKDSIRDFSFNREAFKRLSVKRYRYKSDSSKIEYINPMAQALEVEFPWLVNHSKSKIVRNDSIISISTLSEDEKLNIKDEDRLHTIKSMQLSITAMEGLRLEMIRNDSLQLIVDENKLQIEILKALYKNIDDRLKLLEN